MDVLMVLLTLSGGFAGSMLLVFYSDWIVRRSRQKTPANEPFDELDGLKLWSVRLCGAIGAVSFGGLLALMLVHT